MILTYIAGTNRSSKNDTAQHIAETYCKRIVRLEKDEEQLWPLMQKIAFATLGATSIFISPFLYGYLKLYGDPYEAGTKAYKKRTAEKKSKKSLFSRFIDFAYESNLDQRNRAMAEKSIDILRRNTNNLLVVCGEEHLDGIVENLYGRLRLKEVKSFP